MADDIDDLLDEVEAKFVTKSPKKNKEISKTKSLPKKDRKSDEDDLSSIIDDICGVPEPLEIHDVNRGIVTRVVTSAQQKCYPVYLGGSGCSLGLANSTSQRSCDRLRCTDCDFKVATFDGFSWNPSTDYLFLRNNAPDFKKLSHKLIHKSGYRAYCCQCRWKSVNNLTNTQNERDLKWVCGKH